MPILGHRLFSAETDVSLRVTFASRSMGSSVSECLKHRWWMEQLPPCEHSRHTNASQTGCLARDSVLLFVRQRICLVKVRIKCRLNSIELIKNLSIVQLGCPLSRHVAPIIGQFRYSFFNLHPPIYFRSSKSISSNSSIQ